MNSPSHYLAVHSKPVKTDIHPGLLVTMIAVASFALIVFAASKHSGSVGTSLNQVGEYYTPTNPAP